MKIRQFIAKRGVTICPPCFSAELKAHSIRQQKELAERLSEEARGRYRRRMRIEKAS